MEAKKWGVININYDRVSTLLSRCVSCKQQSKISCIEWHECQSTFYTFFFSFNVLNREILKTTALFGKMDYQSMLITYWGWLGITNMYFRRFVSGLNVFFFFFFHKVAVYMHNILQFICYCFKKMYKEY